MWLVVEVCRDRQGLEKLPRHDHAPARPPSRRHTHKILVRNFWEKLEGCEMTAAPKKVILSKAEEKAVPTFRLDYDKLLDEFKKSGGNMSKAARICGVSRESAYWRAKRDPEFKAKFEAAKAEIAVLNNPTQAVPESVMLPDGADLPPPQEGDLTPVLGVAAEQKPEWQRHFEASLRTYGLPPIAAIHAKVEFTQIEKLMVQNPDFAARCRQLCDEANSRILFFARERAMSGKADQVLLAWLKAYNENFRDKASVQVSGMVKHQHGHVILTPQMLEQVEKAEAARREFIEDNKKTIEAEVVKSEAVK